ncbi:hypothetical protein ACFT0G_06070 [Streptomyces sp. NPDC057020]|uniref:hypothetical protein n=1 Tax=unclassified Streptomyces TaxID=2593676 RepID=UPI003635E138
MSGFLAAGVYEDGGEGQTTVVFHMEEVDATLSGRKLGSQIADFCASLWPDIPLSLMIGTTVDGATPVKRVLLPAVRARLREVAAWARDEGDEAVAARAAEEFTHDLYCANIAGAPRDVGRKITMHQRIGELTTALELERLRILGDLPLFEDVTNALRSFDPSKRSSEGKDLWDAGAREGLITALTVLPKTVAFARAYRAETGPDGRPRMVDVTSPRTGYGGAPASYASPAGVFGIDGTVLGVGSVFGARPGRVEASSPYADSYLRPQRLEQVVSAWRRGEREPVERAPSAVSRSTQRAQRMTGGSSLARPPVYGEPPGMA